MRQQFVQHVMEPENKIMKENNKIMKENNKIMNENENKIIDNFDDENPIIDSFTDQYAFLSNFYPSEVILDGDDYPTVEHAFQAAKTMKEHRHPIRNAKTPGIAKRLGRQVDLRNDWEKIKTDVMLDLLRKKFSDSFFQQQLIDTGEAELVEGNTWNDLFWGVDAKTGIGRNMLGRLLMRVRSEIKNQQL